MKQMEKNMTKVVTMVFMYQNKNEIIKKNTIIFIIQDSVEVQNSSGTKLTLNVDDFMIGKRRAFMVEAVQWITNISKDMITRMNMQESMA